MNINVRKLNKNIEKFDLNKIKISLERTAEDVKMPLNKSDIKIIHKYILNNLEKEKLTLIDTRDIRLLITHALIDNGFKCIAIAYNKKE